MATDSIKKALEEDNDCEATRITTTDNLEES